MADRNQEVLRQVLRALGARASTTEKDPTLQEARRPLRGADGLGARRPRGPHSRSRADLDAHRRDQDPRRRCSARSARFAHARGRRAVPSDRRSRIPRTAARRSRRSVPGRTRPAGSRLLLPQADAKSDTRAATTSRIMARMFELAGRSGRAGQGATPSAVMTLETALADSSMTRVALRDPQRALSTR